jgi:rubrerythrin
MEVILENKNILIFIVILIGIGILMSMIKKIINRTKRNINRAINRTIDKTVNRATQQVLGVGLNEVTQLVSLAQDVSKEPEEKSVSGATNVYLPKITKDFVDFHNSEVLVAIKVFINEYLDIKYKEKTKFEYSNIEQGLEEIIPISQTRGNVYDVNIHKTAICNYNKTNEYATITYQVAVGYNINSERKEERYKVEYTLKLSENGIADKILTCDNCGATIDSTAIEVCPYCDTRIIRDTRMSWRFTTIAEC